MAEAKSSLGRDGTMQGTAKEGIAFLSAAGSDKLLEMQGLKNPEPEKPAVQRDGTMVGTAKEAERILGKNKPDDDAKTRGQQTKLDELKEEPEPVAKKVKLAKGVTMIGTAKEAAQILGDSKPDADALTRGQQKKLDEISKEVPASPAKKPRMSKEGTMAATAKEAKAYYIGKEKLGDTRSESKALQKKPSPPKKTTSMAKTIGEAAFIVPNVDVNEGRRTRSSGKSPAKPAVKREGTMQKTAKAGKEFLKRGKRGKAAEEAEEDAE